MRGNLSHRDVLGSSETPPTVKFCVKSMMGCVGGCFSTRNQPLGHLWGGRCPFFLLRRQTKIQKHIFRLLKVVFAEMPQHIPHKQKRPVFYPAHPRGPWGTQLNQQWPLVCHFSLLWVDFFTTPGNKANSQVGPQTLNSHTHDREIGSHVRDTPPVGLAPSGPPRGGPESHSRSGFCTREDRAISGSSVLGG